MDRRFAGTRGSSPRGRGSQGIVERNAAREGFIPAWAGQPNCLVPIYCSNAVHPRVGGAALGVHSIADRGSGSSPRGRGSPDARRKRRRVCGFIPAWAGQPLITPAGRLARRVHPRVGGAAVVGDVSQAIYSGSSPRGRGSPGNAYRADAPERFIPAWAGQPRHSSRHRSTSTVHPRVGGAAWN